MQDETHNYEQQAYQSFLGHRSSLDAAALEISGRFTQWMLTLSGGALALSITFVDKIHPQFGPSSHKCLILSWIFFAFTLITSLSSLYSSYRATTRAIGIHDIMYQARLKDPNATLAQPINTPGYWTDVFTILSIVGFAFGILFFCIFAYTSPPPPPSNAKPTATTTHTSSTTSPAVAAPEAFTKYLRPTSSTSASAKKTVDLASK